VRVPTTLDPEAQQALRELWRQIQNLSRAQQNINQRGRRIINAGSAQDALDYVTLADVRNLIRQYDTVGLAGLAGATGVLGTVPGGGGGGGTTIGGCSGRSAPTVDLYDGLSVVEAYAAANPAQLADSCQDSGGSWDFMDGVVAALQAVDTRFGFNWKRGVEQDYSHDAISYYFGPMGSQTVGSKDCYVVDIIGGHCGDNPEPAWIDVTRYACGGWDPNRSA
jgi:hypothetical protein